MKLNCLVVDDEQLARKLIVGYIERLPHLELVGECKNAMEAIHALKQERVDLLFLDIQMPDLSGVDLLKVMQKKPITIFTTAYQDYALEGYELDVVDYLLKPISFERFIKATNKAIDRISVFKTTEDNKLPEEDEYITLKADHRIHKVLLNDISHIEGLREYVVLEIVVDSAGVIILPQ